MVLPTMNPLVVEVVERREGVKERLRDGQQGRPQDVRRNVQQERLREGVREKLRDVQQEDLRNGQQDGQKNVQQGVLTVNISWGALRRAGGLRRSGRWGVGGSMPPMASPSIARRSSGSSRCFAASCRTVATAFRGCRPHKMPLIRRRRRRCF